MTPIAQIGPRIAKLIPRLASTFDGERLATLAAIERLLRANKADFHDLANFLRVPTPPALGSPRRSPRKRRSKTMAPTPKWDSLSQKDRNDWLIAISESPLFSEWERSFASSIRGFHKTAPRLSEKQIGVIDRLLARAFLKEAA